MGGDGFAIRCQHNFSVAVVRSHKQTVPLCLARLHDDSNGLVRRLHRLDCGLVHARVSHHVRGSEVAHHKRVLASRNSLGDVFSYCGSRHLRLQIVGGHLGRGHHGAHLIFELCLGPPVEEEGDVRVLLRLCAVVLLEPLFGNPLRDAILHHLWWVDDREGKASLVLRHVKQLNLPGLRSFEGRGGNSQRLRQLAHAIRAVIKSKDNISILDSSLGIAHVGLEEFVRLVLQITFFHLCHGV
mmetsp:Transcript_404/g.550  ORF Transcript_404/g.550 Transcript_404/m.550 type:complete len:241 (-) Transcript_404:839-1561(-)